jgi:hypothetical protein
MIGFPFLFYLYRSCTGVDLFYFHILSRPRRELGFGFFFLVFFSIDHSFSVRPNLGHVGFSCGDREKLL